MGLKGAGGETMGAWTTCHSRRGRCEGAIALQLPNSDLEHPLKNTNGRFVEG